MFELIPEDILLLQKRTGQAVPEGMLPVGLEYIGPHGTISTFYCGRLAPRLAGLEEAAAWGGPAGVQLCEKADHSWQVRLCGADPEHAVQGTAAAQTVQDLLRQFGLLPLPGTEQSGA